jgi:hypothetical protein
MVRSVGGGTQCVKMRSDSDIDIQRRFVRPCSTDEAEAHLRATEAQGGGAEVGQERKPDVAGTIARKGDATKSSPRFECHEETPTIERRGRG